MPSWKESIRKQREALFVLLSEPLKRLAGQCESAWPDREKLSRVLVRGFESIPYCTYLYVVDTQCIQVSDNVGSGGRMPEHFGRDRSPRPYMKELRADKDYVLSEAYISLSAHRPSITALQALYRDGERVGYVGADLDLRNLPMTGDLYMEPLQWRQIKGDPAIRGTVFQQTRVESELDRNIDQAISILEELLVERGVFQMVMHFSSSRATIWVVDDPFRYRILQSDALADPNICFAYPKRPYPEDAEIPAERIGSVLRALKALRFADDTIYLRSTSINIFNGLVSLTFSCDGSHYIPWDEFLDKGSTFWF
ncbi:MAG: PDC sensor domain-containing protein [Thiogranum sp.]|nr:PDC sensor domain-containing protein [Thiogranum sp.]